MDRAADGPAGGSGFLDRCDAEALPIVGKMIVKTLGGAVLGEFSVGIANAANQAIQLPAKIADRFPVLQAAGVNRQQMRAFVKQGNIPTPTNRNKLKQAMIATNPPDPNAFSKWSPHAHHELPWGIEVTSDLRSRHLFAEFGFDVNDPAISFFFAPTSHSNSTDGTKRIGPHLDTANAAGHQDTFAIRDRAESLP